MLLFVIIFGTLFAVTLACIGAGFAVQKSQQNKRFRAMLRIANPTGPAREVDVLAPEANYDAFRKFLNSLGPTKSLDQVMDQAGLKWGGAEIIMAAAAAAAAAALLGSRIPRFPCGRRSSWHSLSPVLDCRCSLFSRNAGNA